MSTSIKDMLAYALDAGASDLHLSVGSIPMVGNSWRNEKTSITYSRYEFDEKNKR